MTGYRGNTEESGDERELSGTKMMSRMGRTRGQSTLPHMIFCATGDDKRCRVYGVGWNFPPLITRISEGRSDDTRRSDTRRSVGVLSSDPRFRATHFERGDLRLQSVGLCAGRQATRAVGRREDISAGR